ncbi:flippase [Butyricicoccus porcorum]|nr:flippase [Butyricicoccus porcorum]MCI7738991.1 flippase [Lachnospiraceae bacterium]
MMEKSSVKKNFFYQMIYEVLVFILPFITSPYIARVIGAEGLGIYSYANSIAYYFVLFSMLGLKNYGNRTIAQSRDDRERLNETFSNVAALHIIASTICILTYVGYIVILKGERLYAIIMGAYVLSGLFDISWFYFGIEKFKLTVTRNTLIKIANVICVFVFVRDADDLWKYCMIMSVGTLISQMVLWIPLKKYVTFVKPTWSKMVIHIKPLCILFIPSIAVSLYKYMDKIMIGVLSNKVQLGYYENAEKVINIPMGIITSFGVVMLPKMSNLLATKNRKESQKYMALSMKYIMCLAYALTFGLAGVGTVFAPVFWGEEFALSGILIMGLSLTIPFMSFANVIRTQYLIPSEKDREFLSSVVGGACANLIINTLLIPVWGSVGATIGTIVAEIVVCLIQCLAVRKELPLQIYLRNSGIFLLFGIAMFAAVYGVGSVMSSGVVTLLLQIILGVCIYAGCCLVYFIVAKDQMIVGMLDRLLKKVKVKL